MLAVFSGARQGELLGLKWSDVDYKNNQIHIQRTFNYQTFYDTKTETSNRRVDLGPTMIAQLKKWQLACPPNTLNLMFPNESGQPMNYSNMVQRYYMPALKKAKIKRIKFHCLRHTFASLADPSGRKHQVHSIAAWALIANGDIERLFSPDESGQSRVGLSAGKDHF